MTQMSGHLCIRCNGDERRWYLTLTDESVCHRCYQALLRMLTTSEQRELSREPRDFVECEEKREALWRRLRDDSARRFSLLELD